MTQAEMMLKGAAVKEPFHPDQLVANNTQQPFERLQPPACAGRAPSCARCAYVKPIFDSAIY